MSTTDDGRWRCRPLRGRGGHALLEVRASPYSSSFIAVIGQKRGPLRTVLVRKPTEDPTVFEGVELSFVDRCAMTPDGRRVLFALRTAGALGVIRCHDAASGRVLWEHAPSRGMTTIECVSNRFFWYVHATEATRRVWVMDVRNGEVVERLAGNLSDGCFGGTDGLACRTIRRRGRNWCIVHNQSTSAIVAEYCTEPHTLWHGVATDVLVVGADGNHRGLHCFDRAGHRWSALAPHKNDACQHVSLVGDRVYYSTRYCYDDKYPSNVIIVQELDLASGRRLRVARVPLRLGWHPFDGGRRAISTHGILDYSTLKVVPHDVLRWKWL